MASTNNLACSEYTTFFLILKVYLRTRSNGHFGSQGLFFPALNYIFIDFYKTTAHWTASAWEGRHWPCGWSCRPAGSGSPAPSPCQWPCSAGSRSSCSLGSCSLPSHPLEHRWWSWNRVKMTQQTILVLLAHFIPENVFHSAVNVWKVSQMLCHLQWWEGSCNKNKNNDMGIRDF